MKILDIEDKIKNRFKNFFKRLFGHNQKVINFLRALNPPSVKHLILSRLNSGAGAGSRTVSDLAGKISFKKGYPADKWDVVAKRRFENQKNKNNPVYSWLDSEFIDRNYIRPRVSGAEDVWWGTYIMNKYIPEKLSYGLSLGCGDGTYERVFVQKEKCNEIDAFDIGMGAIEVAKMAARQYGLEDRIHYQAVDVNSIKLPEKKYGLVLCNMALHHFKDLENVYSEISKSLKEDGLFVFNEFVGPTQFQWTDKQVKVINDILKILPDRYRYQPLCKCYKDTFSRPSIKEMNSIDPTEAVRSKDIIPKLENHFSIIERKDYGGTILHTLLQDIICNFDENSQEDMAILQLIFYIEDVLLREGCIESDHSMVVCKKKGI